MRAHVLAAAVALFATSLSSQQPVPGTPQWTFYPELTDSMAGR